MRKIAAMIFLLVYLGVCIFLIGSFASQLNARHPLLQLVFYVVAGLIWIAPLHYVFAWMNKDNHSSID